MGTVGLGTAPAIKPTEANLRPIRKNVHATRAAYFNRLCLQWLETGRLWKQQKSSRLWPRVPRPARRSLDLPRLESW